MHLLFPDANVNRKPSSRLMKGVWTGLRCALIATLAIGVLGVAQGQANKSSSGKSTTAKSKPPAKKPDNKGAGEPMANARVIMVFPPDTKGGVSELVSDSITDVERGRLVASRKYRTVSFSRAIPTIRLGLVEQSITQTDVSHPYDVDSKLKKLSQLASYDMVLATTINDYTYDEKTNSVSVVMSIRLIDFSGEKPVVRSAGASMTSPENPAGNPKQEKIADNVIRSLTEKLMTDLLNPRPGTSPSAESGTK